MEWRTTTRPAPRISFRTWRRFFTKNDYRDMAELKNIRIAISGIYDYAFEELPSLRVPLPGAGAPEWVEKKRIYKVYRPASVLSAACDKFKMLPLTHHHPRTPVDGQNFRDLTIGYTGENPWIDYLDGKDEVGIRSTAVLYDDEAMDAYERGEVQLSPGYIADFAWQQGTDPHGNEYDIVMKEITDVNHLALLPAGRGGEDAVVMDQAPARTTIFDIVKQECHDSKEFVEADVNRDKKGRFSETNESTSHTEEEDDGYPEHDYSEYKGQGQKAVNFLVENQGGQVRGAFNRDEIGDIDVVWGEVTDPEEHEGYGLSHIIDKHGEDAVKVIGDIVEHGKLENPTKGRASIEKDGFRVAIRKSWNGKKKTWIVTGFKKEGTNPTPSSVKDYTAETSLKPFISNLPSNSKYCKSIFDLVRDQEHKTVFDQFK